MISTATPIARALRPPLPPGEGLGEGGRKRKMLRTIKTAPSNGRDIASTNVPNPIAMPAPKPPRRNARATPPTTSAPPVAATAPPQYPWFHVSINGCMATIAAPSVAHRRGTNPASAHHSAAHASAVLTHTPVLGCPSTRCPSASISPCPGGYLLAYVGCWIT